MSRITSKRKVRATPPPYALVIRHHPSPRDQSGFGPLADAYPDAISETDKRALQREEWNRSRRGDKDDWEWAYE